MEALFTSRSGGAALRERLLEVVRDTRALECTDRIDVHVMTFSFTDETIARLLVDLASDRPDVNVRLIADWSQGAGGSGRQVRELIRPDLANLTVRYKIDQPYVWDAAAGQMRWSYRASRGLLHHKTMAVFVDSEPRTLVCGSFNWTEKALHGYENLLVLTPRDAGGLDVMNAIEREFEAMWTDGRVTFSVSEARAHYEAILDEYGQNPSCAATDIAGLGRGADVPLTMTRPAQEMTVTDSEVALIAFSARSPYQSDVTAGYSLENRRRRFDLYKPSGKVKRVPLTLTTLALDTIARSRAGDQLLVAMYGLSARVPEYGALLDAARRGVRLRILLDGRIGRSVIVQLATVAHREELPIRLRASARTMHQKYLIHPETDTVLTGTANLSTDAVDRHSEHRIRWRGNAEIAAAFLSDFDTIWERLASPFEPRPGARPHTTAQP